MTYTSTDYTRRCTFRENGGRCQETATHRFLVNGQAHQYLGATCEAHGRLVIAEYDAHPEIITDTWTIEPLDGQS